MSEKANIVFIIVSRADYEDSDYTSIHSVHMNIESMNRELAQIKEQYRADKSIDIIGEQWYRGEFYHVTYMDMRMNRKYTRRYDVETHETAD